MSNMNLTNNNNSILLPQTELKPTISPGLITAAQSLTSAPSLGSGDASLSVPLGTKCKNNACKAVYEGSGLSGICVHHPGVPVFHEGLKFWSCCTRKTTDFAAFLEQEGCSQGEHVWVKANVSFCLKDMKV